MFEVYEIWGDAESGVGTLISTQKGISDMRSKGLVEPELSPLYSLRASSWEEAMTYHHEHNGWEPYVPMRDV
jgi:hypothetical protein